MGYRSDFGDKLGWVYDLRTTNRTRFCILRIPNIISARGVWFTFISRTQEHRAVGDLRGGTYSSLVGLAFWLLPSPFVPLL